MKENRIERLVCFLYFAGFTGLAVVMMIFQPHVDFVSKIPASPPDEYFRMLIPKFICEHGTLPTGLEEEVRITGYGYSYGLYNMLPYIIQGYVMRFFSLFTDSQLALLYAGRAVNVVSGILMAWVVYLLGKRIFRDSRFRWLFCFAVMYLPENMFVHTYINTDSCCLLSTAIILYALVWAYQEGCHYGNSACLGLGIILCALSYYNAYGYILCSICLFVGLFVTQASQLENQNTKRHGWSLDWKPMLKYGLFISAIVAVGAGWWFVRTYYVLDGDILGLRTRDQLALMYGTEEASLQNTYQARGISVCQMLKENNFFECLYNSFIATFGSLSIRGNRWTYLSYKLFFGAGALGWITDWIARLCRALRHASARPPRSWLSKFDGKRAFIHLNMLLCAMLPLIILIRYAYRMDYQHQGRYILPSLIPIMYYTVEGIKRLAAARWKECRLPSWLINAGVAFALFIAIGSSFFMVFVQALPIYRQLGMML